MRVFLVCILGVFLAACSIEKMAEKLLPDDIEQKSHDVVTAVFAEDIEFFRPLKSEKLSEEDFQKTVKAMFEHRSEGEIISSHIVSANTNTSISSGSGKTRQINISHEIKTGGGYTLVSTLFVQTADDAECCVLASVNVQEFEDSPAHKTAVLIEKVSKIVAVILPLGSLLIFVLVLRARRKKKAAMSS
jgi:hypothetical protein